MTFSGNDNSERLNERDSMKRGMVRRVVNDSSYSNYFCTMYLHIVGDDD